MSIEKAIDLEKKHLETGIQLYRYLNSLSPDELGEYGEELVQNRELESLNQENKKEQSKIKRRIKDILLEDLQDMENKEYIKGDTAMMKSVQNAINSMLGKKLEDLGYEK